MTGYLVVLFLRRTVDQYLGSLSEVHKCDGAGIAYPLVIYYFDNDSEASEVLTMGEEDDTADFDHAPFRGVDLNLGHPEREYLTSISVFTHDRCHNSQTYLWDCACENVGLLWRCSMTVKLKPMFVGASKRASTNQGLDPSCLIRKILSST